MDICKHYMENRLPHDDYLHKRKAIYNILKQMFQTDTMKHITPNDIKQTFYLFDEVYFNKELTQYLKTTGQNITFQSSDKLTASAGMCKKCKSVYQIVMSNAIITNLFNKGEKTLALGGLKCVSRLDCYINIFEHEMIHFIMYLYCPELMGRSGHSPEFKTLVYNLFGHTKTSHSLLMGDIEENKKKLLQVKEQIKIGDHVRYAKNRERSAFGEGKVLKLNPKFIIILDFEENRKWRAPYMAVEKID
jgi:hypothetical protein